jgi:hypothetical protein
MWQRLLLLAGIAAALSAATLQAADTIAYANHPTLLEQKDYADGLILKLPRIDSNEAAFAAGGSVVGLAAYHAQVAALQLNGRAFGHNRRSPNLVLES